jgi:hypothetical protein
MFPVGGVRGRLTTGGIVFIKLQKKHSRIYDPH